MFFHIQLFFSFQNRILIHAKTKPHLFLCRSLQLETSVVIFFFFQVCSVSSPHLWFFFLCIHGCFFLYSHQFCFFIHGWFCICHYFLLPSFTLFSCISYCILYLNTYKNFFSLTSYLKQRF